jgi:streptomycin 6-kinase
MTSYFSENIIKMYGAKGKSWLDELPKIVEWLGVLWNLHDLKVHENLSYNYVVEGLQNKQAIILKIGLDTTSVKNEIAALTAFQGHGVVNLLNTDLDQNALLLERAIPGHTLKNLFPHDDARATNIACNMIDLLHKAPIPRKYDFPILTEQLKILDQDWELPKQYLLKARTLKNTLLKSASLPVLLHGDLHYDNILSHNDDWIIIDPKGVIGDPIFDKIGCLIREPLDALLETPDASNLLNNRINQVSQHFNLNTQKIVDWTTVHTVLASCWCLEDNHDPSKMLKFLEILNSIKDS